MVLSRAMNPTKPLLTLSVLLIAVALAACGGSSDSSSGGSKLSLVAYSTPKEAYDEIIPAFGKTPEGAGTTFTTSYGASGDQAKAIISGLPTDIAALSLEPDITKLVKENIVAPDWQSATSTKGIVTPSVVVIAVRKGNPKNIKGWADLVKPGIEVITPNPFTSGGARWNVMAAYGAQIEQGKTDAQADAYLQQLFKHVPVQAKAARDALQAFTGGKGDALISYENEAITAQQKGEALDYVIPDQTILIENPIAMTKSAGPKAKAFVKYAVSEPAQKIFAAKGYRSIIPSLVDKKTYPDPKKLFEITKFGGWDTVMKKFFDPADSVMQRVEKSLGVSTG
jgi:sulfate/thiosulfate-binding protein